MGCLQLRLAASCPWKLFVAGNQIKRKRNAMMVPRPCLRCRVEELAVAPSDAIACEHISNSNRAEVMCKRCAPSCSMSQPVRLYRQMRYNTGVTGGPNPPSSELLMPRSGTCSMFCYCARLQNNVAVLSYSRFGIVQLEALEAAAAAVVNSMLESRVHLPCT